MIETLREIAGELLSAQTADNGLNAVTRLYSLCAAITGIDENSGNADVCDLTRLPHGEAISPKDAARCLLDYNRTSKFLQGLYAAIIEAQKKFSGETIEILYAGCGPFAPLAVPLTTRFDSAEIKFTLLDVHRRSLDAARLVFQTTGSGEFVRDYVQCDAATYRHESSVHIVVVEAMQAALEREPQAAITLNLARQLCSSGIFIPEKINVDCQLRDANLPVQPLSAEAENANFSAFNASQSKYKLGRVFELNAEQCRRLPAPVGAAERGEAMLAPKVTLAVPDDLHGELYLMLTTTVKIFDNVRLGENESGLTCPKILFDAGKIRAGNLIELAYHTGIKPGFKHRLIKDKNAKDNWSASL